MRRMTTIPRWTVFPACRRWRGSTRPVRPTRLGRLQALANSYVETEDSSADPIVLTLSYTRTGDYNTTIWQLTAGVRDTEFESYVNSSDAELASLQSLNTVTLPTGEKIDFGHLLASMNLVYNGIPITGSWGGDCMQLAQVYSEIELPCKHLLMIGAFSAERTHHLAGCAAMQCHHDGFHGRHIAFSTFGAFVIAGVMLDFHADKADGKNNRSAECQ